MTVFLFLGSAQRPGKFHSKQLVSDGIFQVHSLLAVLTRAKHRNQSVAVQPQHVLAPQLRRIDQGCGLQFTRPIIPTHNSNLYLFNECLLHGHGHGRLVGCHCCSDSTISLLINFFSFNKLVGNRGRGARRGNGP